VLESFTRETSFGKGRTRGEKNEEKRLPIDNSKERVGLTFNNLESMILKIVVNML